jgi:hypothetical protein
LQPDDQENLGRCGAPLTVRVDLGSLAWAELYLTFAAIIHRCDMELHDTTIKNIRMTRDFVLGLPEAEWAMVNAKVTGILKN